jgi:acetylornithine deacetylase/succinyl-diaminopimelate desuccinylase-like protein
VVSEEMRQAVLARIDREELAELALTLGGIASPSGAEGTVGEYLYQWLARHGFNARKVGMAENSFNVMGDLRGRGGGHSLLFNSHMDTIDVPPSDRGPAGELSWRDGDNLYGWGVVNDKGPMAAFMIAAKAIKEAGVELPGDLVLTMVVGECGHEPVDEFSSAEYVGKDIGARYLVSHGGIADFAIVAETSDFGASWVEAGKAWFKLTVRSYRRVKYTPYLTRSEDPRSEANAIVVAAPLIARLEQWAQDYERRNTYHCPGGTVIPKVNLGAIRGGRPFHVTVTPWECYLYLDVRTVPNQDALAIRQELEDLLADADIPGQADLVLYRRGYEAQGIEPLTQALGRAHRQHFGAEMGIAPAVFSSMWRDHNIFNEVGIPALTYGPGEGSGGGNLVMPLDELRSAACVYALAALEVCSTPKDPSRAPVSMRHGA